MKFGSIICESNQSIQKRMLVSAPSCLPIMTDYAELRPAVAVIRRRHGISRCEGLQSVRIGCHPPIDLLVGNKALALKNLMAEIAGSVLMGDCNMMMYGRGTCAICKKACKALEAAGKEAVSAMLGLDH